MGLPPSRRVYRDGVSGDGGDLLTWWLCSTSGNDGSGPGRPFERPVPWLQSVLTPRDLDVAGGRVVFSSSSIMLLPPNAPNSTRAVPLVSPLLMVRLPAPGSAAPPRLCSGRVKTREPAAALGGVRDRDVFGLGAQVMMLVLAGDLQHASRLISRSGTEGRRKTTIRTRPAVAQIGMAE